MHRERSKGVVPTRYVSATRHVSETLKYFDYFFCSWLTWCSGCNFSASWAKQMCCTHTLRYVYAPCARSASILITFSLVVWFIFLTIQNRTSIILITFSIVGWFIFLTISVVGLVQRVQYRCTAGDAMQSVRVSAVDTICIADRVSHSSLYCWTLDVSYLYYGRSGKDFLFWL